MAAGNSFRNAEGPARFVEAVTPSDADYLTQETRALYIGVAGNVAVMVNGDSVTFVAVPAGTVLPVQAEKVLATGTTATSIVAMA